MYGVGIRISSGKIVKRFVENLVGLPDVTDDGETVCLIHDADDFPFTANMCNAARARRSYWRKTYAAAGMHYPD
jgi:hypothetical protein